MVKFYYSILFLAFSFCSISQNLPYLNASVANIDEFPVDKDTSIYMFHGNRLVKTDKNFNVIWANTYGTITFTNLLLSKTGSMFFIGTSGSGGYLYGKIAANGSLSWVKDPQNTSVVTGTTTTNYSLVCSGIMLDRNNHLVITGGTQYGDGYIFKTDTNGTDITFRSFFDNYGCTDRCTILEDSAGFYKFVGLGFVGAGYSFGLHTFSDASNTIISTKEFGISNMFNVRWNVIRSKFSGNYYIRASGDIATPPLGSFPFDRVLKFNTKTGPKWGKAVSSIATTDIISLSETPSGSLLCSMGYTSAVAAFAIDSNGVVGTNYMYLNNNNPNIWSGPPQVIRNNDYYFYLTGSYFSLNPLTVQKFDSTFTFSCFMGGSVTSGPGNMGLSSAPSPTLDPVTSYTIPFTALSVSPVTFSINTNYCQALYANEINSANNDVLLYPNPSSDKIKFNFGAQMIDIFDVNGKRIKTVFDNSEIDVSSLSQGIYFIHIKTDQGKTSKKFIKN